MQSWLNYLREENENEIIKRYYRTQGRAIMTILEVTFKVVYLKELRTYNLSYILLYFVGWLRSFCKQYGLSFECTVSSRVPETCPQQRKSQYLQKSSKQLNLLWIKFLRLLRNVSTSTLILTIFSAAAPIQHARPIPRLPTTVRLRFLLYLLFKLF